MSAKTILFLALGISGAVLVYTVTNRLSDQTLDVLVGLGCGIAATVPLSVGVLVALTRKRREEPDYDQRSSRNVERGNTQYPQRQPYPPVIVINPQHGQFPQAFGGILPPGMTSQGQNMNGVTTPRDFRIVGDDDDGYDA